MVGLVLLLAVAQPSLDELLQAMRSSDPKVRRAAQEAIALRCERLGEEGLAWLRSRRPAEPEVRRRLGNIEWRLVHYLTLEGSLEPFARAGLSRGAFVRYDTGKGTVGTDRTVPGWGFLRPRGVVLDCTLVDAPARDIELYDFDRFCREYLEGKVAPRRDGVVACTLAFWALRAGKRALAYELREAAYAWSCKDKPGALAEPEFREAIRKGLARALATRAVRAAKRGAPRAQCHALWLAVRRVDPEWAVARDAVRGMEQLVVSDRQWSEPDPGAFKRMSLRDLARYHVHHLRDCTTSRYLTSHAPWLRRRSRALLELGWHAIPELIPLLEDKRPTRGECRVEDDHGEYAVPMTHGELCRAILFEITGQAFPSAKAGMRWWHGARPQGATAYYLAMFSSGAAGDRARAAGWLLRLDSIAHRERILRRVVEGPREERTQLLAALHGHLDTRHRDTLLRMLDKDDDSTLLPLATLLWDACGEDYGMRLLAAKISRPDVDFWAVCHATAPLARVDRPFAHRTLIRLLETGNPSIRNLVLEGVGECRGESVIRAVLPSLDDRAWTRYGRRGIGGLRTCDLAARSLAEMTGYPYRFRVPRPVAARDREIRALKEWVVGERLR